MLNKEKLVEYGKVQERMTDDDDDDDDDDGENW